MTDQRFAAAALVLAAWSGCGDSVGYDDCVGVTRCTAPKVVEAGTQPTDLEVQQHLAPLAELRTLASFADGPLAPTAPASSDSCAERAFDVWSVDAEGRIWAFRCGDDATSVAVSVFSPDGDLTTQQTVALGAGATCQLVVASPSPVTSGGPIVTVQTLPDCEGCDATNGSTLAFGADPDAAPTRLNAAANFASHAKDGALWALGLAGSPGGLYRVDADGSMPIQQRAMDAPLPGDQGLSGMWDLRLSGASDGSVLLWRMAIAGPGELDRRHSFWRIDPEGSPAAVLDVSALPQDTVGQSRNQFASDTRDRAVLFTTNSGGDLVIVRADPRAPDRPADVATLRRDDYFDRFPGSLSADELGNLYFTTSVGLASERGLQVCQLPLDGALTCHELSGLELNAPSPRPRYPGTPILIGAHAGVLYVVDPACESQLRRFAWP